MSYMGLDIGTTGCKAVVFDEDGQKLASSYREYKILTPHQEWAELDSAQVCDYCFEVISEAATQCLHEPVRGLGISSQGEAFTPISSKGEILANAMVSSDTRATDIAYSWSKKFGQEKLYHITGHTAHPMFTLFKLLWLRENQPEIWSKARKFFCFEDLLHSRLGLEPAIGWPLAGRTMMFDVQKHDWDNEILSALEIDRSRLARPMPSGSIVGRVSPVIARKLGFSQDVIVVTGGHDQACGALGAGVITTGLAMYATGTVECISPAFDSPAFSEELFRSNLCTYDHAMNGMYTTVAFSLTGGNILRWFRDEWGQEEVQEAARIDRDAYELLLEHIIDIPSRLMVLPYFTPTGTPYFDTKISGAILGLRLTTKREEVLRALLEGVAFEMRLNLDILERSGVHINELRAIGGGAKSRIWTQIKADVMNKPITTVAVTEAGCLGGAMLACAADTKEDLKTLVDRWVKTISVVEPNPENVRYYQDRFNAVYTKLYPALRSLKL